MNWVAFFAAVAGIAALAAVFVAWFQLNSMRKATRSQAYSSITADLHALDKLLITDPNLYQLLDNLSPTAEDGIKQKWLVF